MYKTWIISTSTSMFAQHLKYHEILMKFSNIAWIISGERRRNFVPTEQSQRNSAANCHASKNRWRDLLGVYVDENQTLTKATSADSSQCSNFLLRLRRLKTKAPTKNRIKVEKQWNCSCKLLSQSIVAAQHIGEQRNELERIRCEWISV